MDISLIHTGVKCAGNASELRWKKSKNHSRLDLRFCGCIGRCSKAFGLDDKVKLPVGSAYSIK